MNSFYRLLLLSLWLLSATFSGYSQSQCGNNDDEGPDPPCTTCPCPGTNKFNPYTGNVHRNIKDLEVWGGVGETPLVWMRYYNSRGLFMWDFSYHLLMFDDGSDTQGRARVRIHYPEGGENVFTQQASNPSQWLPVPGINKRLFQQGNIFFLQMANGYRYRFEKITPPSGSPYYQLQDFRDSQQNLYTLTYNTNRKLTRVTEPAGRYLQIVYSNLGGREYISRVTTSDGRSVQYNYDIFNDGVSRWIRLLSAQYGDGTQATYTYSQGSPGTFLSVAHAIDPRYEGNAVNMKYTYNYSIAAGFIKEEKNGVTDSVMVTLKVNLPIRQVCYANGRVETFNQPTELQGRTRAYTDGLGRTRRYTYDQGDVGFLKTETDALGRVTTYNARTAYGNPLDVTHPDGSRELWTRDNLDLILTHTDELGRVTTYTRDTNHRITRIDYPDGTNERFTYNSFGQVLTHTLKNGGIESDVYDSRGLMTSFTDALGNITSYTYDSADRRASMTDARGNIIRYEYNERGLLTRMINADGSSQLYGYDTFGNRTTTTDELIHISTTVYDEFRRPLSQTDPLNRVTQYAYDLPGGVCGCAHEQNTPTRIILPSGRITEREYDVEWQLIRQTAGVGTSDVATTFYEYDLVGKLQMMIDPRGKNWTYGYDVRNRRISARDPLGNTTVSAYDVVGNVLTVKRPDNGQTVNQYDAMNRLTQSTDPKGQVSKMTYDAQGNRIQLTDANNQIYGFQYDLLNRQTRMIYPGGSFENYTYNAVGNRATYTTREGLIRQYTYDNRNRETLSDWSDTTPDVTRTYDADSRLLTLSSSVSSLSYTYNNANELTSETQAIAGSGGAKTVSYGYNADGLGNTMTYPSGTVVSYDYTTRNQIRSISADGPAVATYTYDLNGNRITKALSNSTTTGYGYDNANRMLSIDNQKGGVSFGRFDYGYDNVDRRTFVRRDNAKGDVYGYDAIDQVTGVQYDVTNPQSTPTGPARTVSYGLDAAGNRTGVTDNGATTAYTANNLNQYTTVGGNALTYTGNGNLQTFDGWTYTYDAQNRLIKAQKSSATVDFAYDARNRNVKRTVNGIATFFFYGDWNLIEERNASDGMVAKYVHGVIIDELLTKVSPTQTVYYHQDALGSVTHITNLSGNVVEKYSYDVFGTTTIKDGTGVILSASAFENRFLFNGREFIKEISLYDYRNRIYSAALGRFLQTDPIQFNARDLNLYRYVGNDPLNKIDPDGKSALGALCRASCAALGGGACAFIACACTLGSTVTIGATAVPCIAAIVGGCAAAAGAGTLCAEICQP